MNKLDIKGPYIPYNKDKEPISFYTSAEGIYFDSDLDQTLENKVETIKSEVLTYAKEAVTGIKGDSYGGCETKYAVLPKDLGDLTQLQYATSLQDTSWYDTSPTATAEYPHLWKRVREYIVDGRNGTKKLGTPSYEYCGSLGESGVDGAGREWVFKLSADDNNDENLRDTIRQGLIQELEDDYDESGRYQLNDHIPKGWDDDEIEVTSSKPLLWAASRKYNTSKGIWEKWGTPYLYNRRSIDGNQLNVIYTVSDAMDSSLWEEDKEVLLASITLETAAGTVSNFPEGTHYVWRDNLADVDEMAMVYSATAYFNNDGCYQIDAPIKITGANGIGSDGADIEFAYCTIGEQESEWDADIYKMDPNNPEQHYNNTDKAVSLWVDTAADAGLDPENCYCYMRQRRGQYTTENDWYWYINNQKYGKGDKADIQVDLSDTSNADTQAFISGNYGWSTPTMWSRWGVDGTDGDGIEYVYLRLTKDEFDYLSTLQEWTTSNGVWPNFTDSSSQYPTTTIASVVRTWTDDPLGVNEEYPYEYVCIRKNSGQSNATKKSYPNWSAENITLWNNYAENVSHSFSLTIPLLQCEKKTTGSAYYEPLIADTTTDVNYFINGAAQVCDKLVINDQIIEETGEYVASKKVQFSATKNETNWTIAVHSTTEIPIGLEITGYVGKEIRGTVAYSIQEAPKDGREVVTNFNLVADISNGNLGLSLTGNMRWSVVPARVVYTFEKLGGQDTGDKTDVVFTASAYAITNNSPVTIVFKGKPTNVKFEEAFQSTITLNALDNPPEYITWVDCYRAFVDVYDADGKCMSHDVVNRTGTEGQYYERSNTSETSMFGSVSGLSTRLQTTEQWVTTLNDATGDNQSQFKQTYKAIDQIVSKELTDENGTTKTLKSYITSTAESLNLGLSVNDLALAGLNISLNDTKTDGSVTVYGEKFSVQDKNKSTALSCDSSTGNLNIKGDLTASSFLVSANAGTALTADGDWAMAITTWAKAKELSNGTNSSISSDVTDTTPVFLIRQGTSFFVLNPLSLGKGSVVSNISYYVYSSALGYTTANDLFYDESSVDNPNPGVNTPIYSDIHLKYLYSGTVGTSYDTYCPGYLAIGSYGYGATNPVITLTKKSVSQGYFTGASTVVYIYPKCTLLHSGNGSGDYGGITNYYYKINQWNLDYSAPTTKKVNILEDWTGDPNEIALDQIYASSFPTSTDALKGLLQNQMAAQGDTLSESDIDECVVAENMDSVYSIGGILRSYISASTYQLGYLQGLAYNTAS